MLRYLLQHSSSGCSTSLPAYHIARSEYHCFGWTRRFYLVSLKHVLKAYHPASGFHSSAYPSVYVVFKDISATGECGVVGPTYAALTRSFAPSAIMTFPLTKPALGEEEPLNYADLFSNCITREANESNIGLQEANPAWATCTAPQRLPIFDPPRTLGPATTLGPVQTSASSNPESTAAPASLAGPPVPSKTAPPSQPPPATWSENDPPATDPPPPNDLQQTTLHLQMTLQQPILQFQTR